MSDYKTLEELQALIDAIGQGMAAAKAGRFGEAEETLRRLKADYETQKNGMDAKKTA